METSEAEINPTLVNEFIIPEDLSVLLQFLLIMGDFHWG